MAVKNHNLFSHSPVLPILDETENSKIFLQHTIIELFFSFTFPLYQCRQLIQVNLPTFVIDSEHKPYRIHTKEHNSTFFEFHCVIIYLSGKWHFQTWLLMPSCGHQLPMNMKVRRKGRMHVSSDWFFMKRFFVLLTRTVPKLVLRRSTVICPHMQQIMERQ